MRYLLFAAIVVAIPLAVHAETARIRVVAKDTNLGVPATLTLRVNGVLQDKTVDTDGQGTRDLPNACDASLEIKARPLIRDYYGDGAWKPCSQNPLPIAVKPSRIVARAAGDTRAASLLATKADHEAFWAALRKDDSSSMAVYSNEVAAKLRQAGQKDLSNTYAAAAIASGVAALWEAGVPMPDTPLTYDAQQNAFVSTSETLDALAKFKASVGLPVSENPQWDGQTFRAIQTLQEQRGQDEETLTDATAAADRPVP